MKILKWDTDFWGINFFHLDNPKDFSDQNIPEFSIVQCLVDSDDKQNITELEKNQFEYIESKVTLYKKTFLEEVETKNFHELCLEDIKFIKNMFYELYGQNSRYSTFSKESINNFYYTWVENSIKGNMDDKCIGYFIEGQLAGFFTYRIRNKILTIGLFGILPMFQGQGVAKILLDYITNFAYLNDAIEIRVSTQGHNLNAIKAYKKNGYEIYDVKNWYYYKKGVGTSDCI